MATPKGVATAVRVLLRIELDDQLLINRDLHQLVAPGHSDDSSLEIVAVHIHPTGAGRVGGGIAGCQDGRVVPAGFTDGHFVVRFHDEGRYIDLAAIDLDMAVAYDLT